MRHGRKTECGCVVSTSRSRAEISAAGAAHTAASLQNWQLAPQRHFKKLAKDCADKMVVDSGPSVNIRAICS